MNKIIIGGAILAVLAIGWFILSPGESFDYVTNINQEVTQLENELAQLDAQVTAGTLTAEQATKAKVRIITRLDTISESAKASEKTKLTPTQREQLANGLLRLKDALVSYQATLAAVDQAAIDTEVTRQLNTSNGRSSRHLTLIVADTIEAVEDTVIDSVRDYEADTELDAEVEAVIEEVESKVTVEVSEEETGVTEEEQTETAPEAQETDSSSSAATEEVISAELEIATETGTESEAEPAQ